jgi:hypothetical protein
MSWRVVMCRMVSEYSSASSACTSSCLMDKRPMGILMRIMPGASHCVSGPLVSGCGNVSVRCSKPSLRRPLS